MEHANDWTSLNGEILSCEKCGLCRTRLNAVPGEGDVSASLMFIGEGPGQEEDRAGRPFVGRSGALLTRMIRAIRIERQQVFICNVVKCRPPGNRNPSPDEAAACLPYLRAQIELVSPKICVLLGKVASEYVLGERISVNASHGRIFERDGILYMPTFHPSALLRDPALKKDSWYDFRSVRLKLEEMGGLPHDEG